MKTISIQYRRGCVAGLLALAIAGCHRQDGAGHSHAEHSGHQHEEKTAQITIWTARHEVFAEHKAPVVGKPTTFITHVTDLHTLEPRRDGPVKFVLRQGDTVAEHPQAAPARAGIYLPDIVFPKVGDWQVTLLIPVDGTNAVVELGAVKVHADAHAAAHADIPDAPEGVSFLKEQQWKILSKVEPVTKRRLVARLPVPAEVAARPGSRAAVTAPLAGRLLAAPGRALPLIGDTVTAGQTLALVQPMASELALKLAEAEAESVRAKLAAEQAEQVFKRTQKLAEAQAKSPRELQEAEFALKSAQARQEAARTVLAVFQQVRAGMGEGHGSVPAIELKSPITGTVVAQADAAPGEWVTPDKPLFTVLDAGTVFVEARVPETAVGRLAGAMEAHAELPGARGAFLPLTGEGRGRRVFLSPQVDAATRTVVLVYETANRDGLLRIGQRLTLHIETARAEDAVAVPENALVEEGDQLVVFVQISGETFEKRDIKPGLRDAGFVQVLDGLKEGERIVTKGAYALRLSSISGVIPAHGHAH